MSSVNESIKKIIRQYGIDPTDAGYLLDLVRISEQRALNLANAHIVNDSLKEQIDCQEKALRETNPKLKL